MTRKQLEQVTMQKAVKGVMDKHHNQWKSVPELKNRYELFVRNLKKIDDHSVILLTDLGSLKKKKSGSKKKLMEQLFTITSVLGVYALDSGDSKLGRLVNVKFGDLEKMKTGGLLKYGNRIHGISSRLLEDKTQKEKKPSKHPLVDYGINLKHLKGVRDAIEDFGSKDKALKDAKRSKKVSHAKLVKRIKENNSILKKRLDRFMHLYRDQQNDFYTEYIKVRLAAEPVSENKKPKGNASSLKKAAGTEPAKNKNAKIKSAENKATLNKDAGAKGERKGASRTGAPRKVVQVKKVSTDGTVALGDSKGPAKK